MNRSTTVSTATIVALSLALFTGCSSTPAATGGTGAGPKDAPAATQEAPEQEEAPAPIDLDGEWKQVNSKDANSYQWATIKGDTIVIDWVNDAEDMKATYWVGTVEEPAPGSDPFTWESTRDTSESGLLASTDDTKKFTVTDGILTYELSAMDVTMTVEMEKQ
ncbi:hypothetical protein [Microbacterium sp. 77mftsu3.1]|uniref:hypothetical protein n=1 Tax=Microbacterium sp. 77mftsu3.1 TaxID=1761802 RepID=UPI00037866E5|nr:hypothetical protein [Microbacterium sp. 77mftsu3.1]SDH40325.1 hypothetical protein SAMN04488590_3251 [Microbacterium sp. 77mftsu3.1]